MAVKLQCVQHCVQLLCNVVQLYYAMLTHCGLTPTCRLPIFGGGQEQIVVGQSTRLSLGKDILVTRDYWLAQVVLYARAQPRLRHMQRMHNAKYAGIIIHMCLYDYSQIADEI